MFKQIYVITDLGPGDGGKGSIVHALSRKVDAQVVIKRGGAQGSHGIRTSSGESFNFSQWGCGTLEGVPTFLSSQMVIAPVGLENESEALKRLGIYDPYVLISADPNCICTTPYHKISSQLEELLLGDNPRGTIGTGVGRAYRMNEELGNEFTIRAHELTDRSLVRLKLKRQLDYYRERYAKITKDSGLPDDVNLFSENLDLLYDDDFLPYIENLFEDVGKKLEIKELEEVIKGEGSAIIECSHGVLTDKELGFHPHVSAIRTLPKFTADMLRKAGYSGEIVNFGVHRAYEIRHGAGPMPTYDEKFTKQMLPGSHKDENRFQGIIRAGALDLNLLNYAISACSATTFDGIVLTWFDQILATGRVWQICTRYANNPKTDETCTDFLYRAEPILDKLPIENPIRKQDLFDLVNNTIEKSIGIPLKVLSIGSTDVDKIYAKNFKEV